MRQPFEKLIQLQLILLILAIFAGFMMMWTATLFFSFFACIAVISSFFIEGYIELKKGYITQAGHQMIRAILLIIFISYLYIT
ncbi:hypothetical protein BN1058_00370 [Paraliobacillus sp. PM-2]|uniref:hypothetical protein n=1 Tax=Paraliobacillus sp. PM-2 TaxID=1462524 RepID=UPI00061C4E38|nr:hypothetical protein [Paraliobacillus sp. PM-2]CQR46121.1 hypothetical protein BN1058_00370 [Paraliobacillus sp. PM-2]